MAGTLIIVSVNSMWKWSSNVTPGTAQIMYTSHLVPLNDYIWRPFPHWYCQYSAHASKSLFKATEHVCVTTLSKLILGQYSTQYQFGKGCHMYTLSPWDKITVVSTKLMMIKLCYKSSLIWNCLHAWLCYKCWCGIDMPQTFTGLKSTVCGIILLYISCYTYHHFQTLHILN